MSSPHTRRTVHLLDTSDAQQQENQAAAHLVTRDGRRWEISAPLLTAVEHVIDCAQSNYAAMITPLHRRIGLADAASVTEFSIDHLRQLTSDGLLAVEADDLGGTVLLEGVLALEEQQRTIRGTSLQRLADEDLWEDD